MSRFIYGALFGCATAVLVYAFGGWTVFRVVGTCVLSIWVLAILLSPIVRLLFGPYPKK